MKTYKVVKSGGTPGHESHHITVPSPFGEMLHGRKFTFELTDEGLLYRPAETPHEPDVPAWMRKEPKP